MRNYFPLIVILMIFCFGCSTNSAQPAVNTNPIYTSTSTITQQPTAKPVPVETKIITPTLDAKTEFEDSLQIALGASNRKVPRIREISYDQFEQGDILVEWSINNPRMFSAYDGAKDDVAKILVALNKSNIYFYTSIVLHGYYPDASSFWDNEKMVVNLEYKKSGADQVSGIFANTDDIFTYANKILIDPAFQGQ